MRILQVVSLGYEAGGAEKLARIIRDGMQELGHEVFTLSTDKNSGNRDIFATALVPAVSGGSLERLFKYFWNYEMYRKARAVMHSFNPDIVHLHTISEFSPSLIWGIGKTPAILTVHGPEEFTRELLPWLLPASDYNNGSYRWQDIRLVGRLRYCYLRYIQRPAYLLALKRLGMVTVPSNFMAHAIAADFPRTSVVTIYPAIVLPRKASLPRSIHPTVLYVGRLEVVKGVDYLITAFAHVFRDLPDARLRVVGDGNHREALENLTKQLGLSGCVEFAGWVKPDQIHHEYTAASVVAIPSVCPEALGLVGLEALAIGRPIVGSNMGGIPELIDANVTGAIVEPRDEHGLARAIGDFLSDPRKLADAASAAAVKACDFDIRVFVGYLLNAYQQVLDEHAGR
jgi:glycosyltransferase involved in cell wall biosynthesis